MWKLIPRPVRRWVLLAVAVPVGAWLLDQAAEVIAPRTGETRTTTITAGAAQVGGSQPGGVAVSARP